MSSISLLPSGRYQAKIRRKGVHTSSTFRTKYLARDWAKETEDLIDRGKYNPAGPDPFTIPELLNRYIKEITPRKKSWKVETYTLRKLADAFPGPVSDLTAADVVEYVDKRIKSGVKPATIIKELNKLSHALDTGAALWGCTVVSNPVGVAKRILATTRSLKVGEGRDRRLTDSERGILLNSRIGNVIEFALETGIRRGEIVRADPAHIRGNTLHIAETKTKPRTIPLSARAKEILEAEPFVYAASTLSKMFRKICRENDIVDLCFHDLRHEATSRFFEKGLSIEEVATITGHSDWRMLKRYTHLKPGDIAKKL